MPRRLLNILSYRSPESIRRFPPRVATALVLGAISATMALIAIPQFRSATSLNSDPICLCLTLAAFSMSCCGIVFSIAEMTTRPTRFGTALTALLLNAYAAVFPLLDILEIVV